MSRTNQPAYISLLLLLLSLLSLDYSSKAQNNPAITYKDSLTPMDFPALTYNDNSKLVSVTEVMQLPNVSQQDIYKRVYSWYSEKLTELTQVNSVSKKNDKKGDGQLGSIELTYGAPPGYGKNFEKLTLNIAIYNLKSISIFAPGADDMSGYEVASVIVLIKDGKYKIELTNFRHIVHYFKDPYAASHQNISHLYEEETIHGLSNKNWLSLRLEGMNKLYKILIDMTNYIRKNPNDDTNF